MELLQLKYFQTIAQFESVTRAASYYNIPQSAMSQTLSRLEKELGYKLFERKNNRIYLNDQGKVFLEAVNTSLSALEAGKNALKEMNSEISGSINLLVLENHRFLVYCVHAFLTQHPGVRFSITHEYNPEQAYDLCISSEMRYKRMQDAIPLIAERIILAVHEEHPLAGREKVTLPELKNEKFITTGMHSALYNITIQKCHEAGFEPDIAIICDDPYFARKYISLNMGISLAPSVSWAGRFRANTKLIEVVDPQIITTSYLLSDPHSHSRPAVTAFLEFVVNESKKIEGNLLS